MEEVFGLPAKRLALGMTVFLVVIFLVIGIGAARRFILVKMGSRNIPRRKGQSTLIVIGLMLSTAIIATSLGIGDTVRYSVRSVALDFLGPTDEIIKGPGRQLIGEEYFDFSQFQNIEQVTRDNKNIEALLPIIEINLPASNDVLELAESNMRVRGVHGEYSDNYDELQNLAGQTVSINALLDNEIYINADSSRILKLQKGDRVSVYSRSGKFEFSIRDVLKNGGLAGGGRNPYILFSLDELQELIGKQGQITEVLVSNSGEGEDSLKLSEDVTKFLRSELTNTDIATKMFGILQGNGIPEIFLEESNSINQTDKETSKTLNQLSGHLSSNDFGDDFIKEIGDYQNQLTILGILDKSGLKEDAGKIAALSPTLTTLRVDDQKSDSVRLAETVATGVTTIFSIFGSFSIMVGMLLIFLVFVLLAAARSTELGMARAVGLKRRDLVQLFTYEGTIYAFLAAIVGTVVGVGLSFGLVFILQDLIDSDEFVITPYYSVVSLLIAFSTGLILTFITVVFSAYRASNLNIVVAIRGLKDEFVKKAPDSIGKKARDFVWNLIFPVRQLVWIIRGNGGRMRNFGLLLLFPVVWPINILTSLFRLSGKHNYLVPGIFSMLLLLYGISTEVGASLSIGLIGSALTVGLFARYLCSKFINDTETGNQIAGTLEGGLVLLSNSLPYDFFSRWLPDLSEPGPWFWPVGGAISTAAAVWLLMSNTRILIALLNLILSRFSGLKAVTKTAISYPMAAKFRTGLTVAMFGLIIFTLMIFSVLNGIQDVATDKTGRVTGGYDIKATITPDLPLTGDIRNSLNLSDFEVVSGASNLRVEVKESEGKNNTYKGARLVSLENEFLDSTLWEMAHFDPNYGATDREIWQALMNDETLVVANAIIIPSGDPFGPPDRSFKSSFIEPGDSKAMDSFGIEMKKRRSSLDPTQLTVIGVIERLASGTGFGGGSATFYSPHALGSKIAQEDVPLDTFYFSLKDKNEASNYSQKLEKIFLANGMNAVSLIDQLEKERATSDAFTKLFQGFSGLGLVVGVAAIGVLSVRAVVERRQSIGVLRAIGFRSSMIRTQFLIESSFITLLGIFVGICLGILQSWLIFLEISKELEGAKFSVPIGEVGVLIGITIIASILASVIPANEASKTYPAEALRYE